MKPITLVQPGEARVCQLRVVGTTLTESVRDAGYLDAPSETRVDELPSAGAAERAVDERVAALVEAGWRRGDDTPLYALLAAHAPWADWARIAEEPKRLAEAWAFLDDPERLAALVERVTGAEVTDGALELTLDGGRAITCALPLAPALAATAPASLRPLFALHGGLWLDDDSVMAGSGFGPPEGDKEFEGTALEGAPVWWFLSEGTTRFTLASGERLYRWEHDGGLVEVPAERGPASLVLEALLAALED